MGRRTDGTGGFFGIERTSNRTILAGGVVVMATIILASTVWRQTGARPAF
jgi:hypothetical protein